MFRGLVAFRAIGLLFGLVGGVQATQATLAGSRFTAPASGSVLDAGSSVRIAWESPRADGDRFTEMELVLSLDGGRTFPVRITKELEPRTRSLLLTVPALPTSHARLALRAGEDGEPGEEEILSVSDEFRIAVDRGEPLEFPLFVRGEWKTRGALSSGDEPAMPDPETFGEAPASVQSENAHSASLLPRPRPLADSPPPDESCRLDGAAAKPREVSPPLLSRAPADAPRRE